MGRMVINRLPGKCPCSLSCHCGSDKGRPGRYENGLAAFQRLHSRLSMRKLYDERGNVYFALDDDIRERLQAN